MAKKNPASKRSRKDAKNIADERGSEAGSSSARMAATTAVAPQAPVNAGQPGKVRAAGKTAKKAPAVTLTDIGDHLAVTFDLPKAHAKIYLAEAVALITKQLRRGMKVRLSGLGVFEVEKRPARKARSPTTGEIIKVKPGKRLVFSATRELKTKL